MNTKQTILIVDDVSDNVDILVNILSKHDLITAIDGQTALNIVQEENIDLILLDIMMPHMDGFEVCTALKNNPKTSHIPVIFLTAKGNTKDVERGFSLGAVDYITKPFSPAELISRTTTHLNLRAYEKDLERRVQVEIQKNNVKEQMVHQQSKQAELGDSLMHIAHQWKQPISTIGSINLLFRTQIESDMKLSKEDILKKLDKIDDLIQFMSQTANTFTEFYKPSNTLQAFSLKDSIQSVLNISKATLKYEGIAVKIESGEYDNTYGNENEFTQVVFSIINNARNIFKIRKVTEPQLKIIIENSKVSIMDNGGGIEKDIIDQMFLAFKSTTNGNGVGLYIAKEIIEKNNGSIHAHNNDEGAVFTIEFK